MSLCGLGFGIMVSDSLVCNPGVPDPGRSCIFLLLYLRSLIILLLGLEGGEILSGTFLENIAYYTEQLQNCFWLC